jgi:hypothetical protein
LRKLIFFQLTNTKLGEFEYEKVGKGFACWNNGNIFGRTLTARRPVRLDSSERETKNKKSERNTFVRLSVVVCQFSSNSDFENKSWRRRRRRIVFHNCEEVRFVSFAVPETFNMKQKTYSMLWWSCLKLNNILNNKFNWKTMNTISS